MIKHLWNPKERGISDDYLQVSLYHPHKAKTLEDPSQAKKNQELAKCPNASWMA